MSHRIITISREFGSGGRTIGRKVAQRLGIPCYDSEIIQKIAQESGFSENYIKDAGEYAPGGFLASAFGTVPLVRPTRTTSGICSTRSLRNWRKRGPVSSWAGALTTSCAARQTV